MSNYVERIKELALPPHEYVVIGSGILDALGIRKARDIDIVASKKLFKELSSNRKVWKKKWFFLGFMERKAIQKDGVEIYSRFKYRNYKYDFQAIADRVIVVDEIPFMNLDDLIELKKHLGRPKDLKDIKLIEEYKKNTKQKTSFD